MHLDIPNHFLDNAVTRFSVTTASPGETPNFARMVHKWMRDLRSCPSLITYGLPRQPSTRTGSRFLLAQKAGNIFSVVFNNIHAIFVQGNTEHMFMIGIILSHEYSKYTSSLEIFDQLFQEF
ncbi:hypothetical protein GOP47_0001375 [Adiantum capillus-veneris]|uniref:Uncharacterized protein n=1 Tax=Adiantum capillus-veneris TaxID=13818 RepID=A0A9D4V8R3_ADICA|nr:hypothetical protein GOP47_0001375 [Adiantum capillus-veneris]